MQSFGTEYNPELYKQSMRILTEVSEEIACFKVDLVLVLNYTHSKHMQTNPRTFFMDANIRDFNVLNPLVE